MIVINPITKFGLCTRPVSPHLHIILYLPSPSGLLPHHLTLTTLRHPSSKTDRRSRTNEQLNVTIESILSINPSLPGDESQIFTSSISNPEDTTVHDDKIKSKEKMKAALRVGSRIVTTGVCVITAILLPGFGKVMAFLGSFSAFLICIILPVSFHSFLPYPSPLLSLFFSPWLLALMVDIQRYRVS
jgi:vesicular inhibitory amino acid transporter